MNGLPPCACAASGATASEQTACSSRRTILAHTSACRVGAAPELDNSTRARPMTRVYQAIGACDRLDAYACAGAWPQHARRFECSMAVSMALHAGVIYLEGAGKSASQCLCSGGTPAARCELVIAMTEDGQPPTRRSRRVRPGDTRSSTCSSGTAGNGRPVVVVRPPPCGATRRFSLQVHRCACACTGALSRALPADRQLRRWVCTEWLGSGVCARRASAAAGNTDAWVTRSTSPAQGERLVRDGFRIEAEQVQQPEVRPVSGRCEWAREPSTCHFPSGLSTYRRRYSPAAAFPFACIRPAS
jgi:uncharacterized ParB-like nuclease family protein